MRNFGKTQATLDRIKSTVESGVETFLMVPEKDRGWCESWLKDNLTPAQFNMVKIVV